MRPAYDGRTHGDDNHSLETRQCEHPRKSEKRTYRDGPDGLLHGGEVVEVRDAVPVHRTRDERRVRAVEDPARGGVWASAAAVDRRGDAGSAPENDNLGGL